MINNDEICRCITEDDLGNELKKIRQNYMQIYDEYYQTGSRDSAFLKDLVDSIKGISALLEVYTSQGGLNPSYALEKLNWSLNIINSVKDYYESKMEEENDE